MDSKSVCAALAVAFALAAAPELAAAAPVCTPSGAAPTTTIGPPPVPPPGIPSTCLTDPVAVQTPECRPVVKEITAYNQYLSAWRAKASAFLTALQQWHAASEAYYMCENTQMTPKL